MPFNVWKDCLPTDAAPISHTEAGALLETGGYATAVSAFQKIAGNEYLLPTVEKLPVSVRRKRNWLMGFHRLSGLRSDGAVVSNLDNSVGRCNVADWDLL